MKSALILSVAFVLVVAAVLLLGGFVVMILSGAIGHAFHKPGFFINFGQAFLINLALTIIGGYFSRNK